MNYRNKGNNKKYNTDTNNNLNKNDKTKKTKYNSNKYNSNKNNNNYRKVYLNNRNHKEHYNNYNNDKDNSNSDNWHQHKLNNNMCAKNNSNGNTNVMNCDSLCKDKTNDTNKNDNCNHIPDMTNFKSFIKIFLDLDNKDVNDPTFTGIIIEPNINEILDPNLYISSKINKTETHDEKITLPIEKTHVNINMEIKNIGDLIHIIDTYPNEPNIEYNINVALLHKIKTPLYKLNNMIGMNFLKENIIDQILYYIQNLHISNSKNKSSDYMHTVLYGPPGTGKTEVAKIIGEIYSTMGILSKGTFKKVTRSDLIAGYLGQTAMKTRDAIKEAIGGVLFIDEAYSLGNEEKRDTYSKECIDTLCEALSDHKDNLMVIIAGYENELNNCFFNFNQGLNSRFTWRYKIEAYTPQELYQIFLKKVNESNWSIDNVNKPYIDHKWFDKNKNYFKYFGRDMELLLSKTKIAHSRRVFCLEPSVKTIITLVDLNKGLENFIKHEDPQTKTKTENQQLISTMYL
jgi:hypothetical protein